MKRQGEKFNLEKPQKNLIFPKCKFTVKGMGTYTSLIIFFQTELVSVSFYQMKSINIDIWNNNFATEFLL